LILISGDINLYAGTPTAGKIIQAGVQFQQAADIYFAVDTSNTVVCGSILCLAVD
jgi:hypothetical protein